MVERIQMIKARLCAPDRPLGAFLFAGPTGVGKTRVARRVAALLLGDERRLIRFDMSEYQEADSVERFAGDPRPLRSRLGLVDAATAEPLPVILLDEIEKAHPRVFDVLLQALGEGRITDARGRTASLTNSLIMMTSNLGSRKAYVDLPRQQGARASWHARVQEAVRRRFRPELVNRLTAILTFSPLGRADILAVAQREIDELLRRRGVRASGLSVVVAPGATEAVLNAGYSEQFGVRPMQRAVDAIIGETLAQLLAAYPDCRNRTLVLDWVSSMGRVCIVPTSQKRAG
jgi:ATP-dependent Clp protease ATP-binding subunit ClpC